jgi:hypothetical protein
MLEMALHWSYRIFLAAGVLNGGSQRFNFMANQYFCGSLRRR